MKNKLLTLALGGMFLGLGATAHGQEVPDRKADQQGRIANGVGKGSLTPHETQHLEHKEGKINKETRRDRAANGGPLTPGEKAKVNRQQNHVSKDIYKDKHNNQNQ